MSPTQSAPRPTRVYIKDGPVQRMRSLECAFDEAGRYVGYIGVNTDGDGVEIPRQQVVTVVRPKVPHAEGSFMQGRHVEVVGAGTLVHRALSEVGATLETITAEQRQQLDPDAAVVLDMAGKIGETPVAEVRAKLNSWVAVVAEDMASALVVLFDPAKPDDDLEWVNPAAEGSAIDLTVTAARMLIQAEQITAEAIEADVQRDRGGDEDERNARAFFEAGNLEGAQRIASPKKVAQWLTTLAAGPDVLVKCLPAGVDEPFEALVTAGPPEDGEGTIFEIEAPDGERYNISVVDMDAWRFKPEPGDR